MKADQILSIPDQKAVNYRHMSRAELEDEIIRLQKLRLPPPVQDFVEEAAQAFAEGRELEAEALVEKVAALLRRDMQVAS